MKKSVIIIIFIYLFLFVINYLTPMSTGDDCLYAFIWQGHSMFTPLSEDAVRVASLYDLLISQCSLYLTWGGRVIGQTLVQLFAWQGKGLFNALNALIGTLLVVEIYWCSSKGNMHSDFRPGVVCWIFFALWSFAPGFSEVFFWLTGACIFLWPAFFLLGFLLPYIKTYYSFQKKKGQNYLYSFGMFMFGIVAGCGNENSIGWIILALLCFLYSERKSRSLEIWMYTGVAGLISGYLLLMLAPGNFARLISGHGSDWYHFVVLKHHVTILIVVLLFQVFLWYFSLRSIYSLRNFDLRNEDIQKDVSFIKILLIVSFGMSATMVFSPEFPIRSGFPGTIPLVIVTCILLRIQKEYRVDFIRKEAKMFLAGLGTVFFVVTASISVYNFYEKHVYMKEILASAEQLKQSYGCQVLCVKPFRKVSFKENLISGFHIPNYNLSTDENSWDNVAFGRYYGIKGIRIVEK